VAGGVQPADSRQLNVWSPHLKIEMHWTEPNFTAEHVYYSALADRAPTVLVTLQPIKSRRRRATDERVV